MEYPYINAQQARELYLEHLEWREQMGLNASLEQERQLLLWEAQMIEYGFLFSTDTKLCFVPEE